VSTSALLGNLDTNLNGVSLGTLRMVFGSGTITLQGYLTQSNYNNSPSVTVTINLGASTVPVTTISNQWMTITKTGVNNTVTVAIKSPGTATMSTLTSGSNFNFVNVVSALLIGDVNYSGGTTAALLQSNISNSVLGYAFADIPLTKLMGKTITFGTTPMYTVTFLSAFQ